MGIKDEKIQELIADLSEEKYEQLRFGDIYPTDMAPTMTNGGTTIASWGFRRFDKKGVLINARAEGVLERSMFRKSFLDRRCVVPASGFYEWDRAKKRYYFTESSSEVLLLCGFLKSDFDRERFIILTKQATPPVVNFHDRIPVMCDLTNYRRYLSDLDFASVHILSSSNIKLKTIK